LIEVRVKVCGLTEVDNALACARAGADWIGLNFHPSSPRSISVDRGADIVRALQGVAEPVGLFVNRPIPEVVEVAARIGLRTVQLHGDESPEYLRELEPITASRGLKILRAFRLSDPASVDRMIAFLDRAEELGCPPYAILVDALVPGQAGGTGRSIPLEILDRLPDHPRLILAGGLDSSNVADRVALVRPWMVDVASGVESSPGVKDVGKVSAFVVAVKEGAARERTSSKSAPVDPDAEASLPPLSSWEREPEKI
jgi:phosphoribosylanthranilate isomerase